MGFKNEVKTEEEEARKRDSVTFFGHYFPRLGIIPSLRLLHLLPSRHNLSMVIRHQGCCLYLGMG